MTLTRVQLKNFTAFADLDMELSPGINVLVGANGTGKTHLMKVCYAACEVSRTNEEFAEKLSKVFLPSNGDMGRIVNRMRDRIFQGADARVFAKEEEIHASFDGDDGFSGGSVTMQEWPGSVIQSTYIPVKEMLSNAPGFRSLYAQREIHFEEVYKDVLDRAYLPPLRESPDVKMSCLLTRLKHAIGGEVKIKNEEFFLQGEQGDVEFTLLAEGMRKLGLLWLLLQNGSLREGSVLFWDEPETNLNPKMFGMLMDVLLELQRGGVQIFFATHDYGILKELELRMREGDEVEFHSLYHDEDTGEIACNTARRYLDIHPNAIEEAFEEIYDRQIERSVGDFGR